MITKELDALKSARAAIEEVIAERYMGMDPVPYFSPTDIGELPAPFQEAEERVKADTDYGNRVRASIHLCLTAAAVALQVSESLMENFAPPDPKERQAQMSRCAEDAIGAAAAANHAALILVGEEQVEGDTLMDVIRA